MPRPAPIAVAFIFVLLVGIAVLAFGHKSAKGQDSHAENHEWYNKLTPNNGHGSCCSGDPVSGDCRVAQARQRDDGRWEAYYKGSLNPGVMPSYWDWFIIPESKILPDALNKVPLHAHICEKNGFVHCFLRGGGGS